MISPAQKNLKEEDSSGSDSGPELSSEPETDRFGFILTNGSTAGSVGPPPELVRQRETKWINIMQQWDGMLLKKTHKVKEQCQKGIPASLRAKCWPLLCAASDRKKKNNNLYQTLDSQPALQSWVEVIERDLDRQFPFHEMFLCKDGHGQRGLFRVLKAYTQYQPAEGYCQAQGPVAAVLLMNMPAEEAFWCLVQISEQYLPGYYSPLLEGVLFDAGLLTWVLKRTCPAAHKHLQLHEVEPLMFATDWLMCLFTRHLPFNTLLRVWDLFFCYGVRVLLQVAVVLVRRVLGRAEQRRQCQGQMETLERLRGVKQEVSDDDDAFIAEVCSVQLSSRDLKKQTAKEWEKWRREKPTSTFDPRGRCQGYRTAWVTVREKSEDRERKKKDKGNLSVPLTRSASTLSLSPSMLQKKLMKSGKANAGEGGAKVVRHQSMGSREDWRSWMSLNLKKVQGLEEEGDVEEDREPRGKSKENDSLEEPTEMDKDSNTEIRQTEENENVREQSERAESERNEMEERKTEETVLRQEEETDVGTEPNQEPTTVVQCTFQHEEEEDVESNSQSQQTSEVNTEETVRPVTGSESLVAAEENMSEKKEECTAEAPRDQETDEVQDSGETHVIQADLEAKEETEDEQQTQVETDIGRTETIPDSETENNEATTLSDPNLTLETQKRETEEPDESSEDDVSESQMEDEEREESGDPPEMEMQEQETKERDRPPEGDQIKEKYQSSESTPEKEMSEELYNQTETETRKEAGEDTDESSRDDVTESQKEDEEREESSDLPETEIKELYTQTETETGGETAEEPDERSQDDVTKSQTEEGTAEDSGDPTEVEIQGEETEERDRSPDGDQIKDMYHSTPERETSEELYNQTEMETRKEAGEETDECSRDDVTESQTETETNEGLQNQAVMETQEKETDKRPASDQIKEMCQSVESVTESETREELNDATETETQEQEATEKDESSHDCESKKESHEGTGKNKTAETDGSPECDHFNDVQHSTESETEKDTREESNRSETKEMETAETDKGSQDEADNEKETEGEDKVDESATGNTEPNPDREADVENENKAETTTTPPESNHGQEGNEEAAGTDESATGSRGPSECDTAADEATKQTAETIFTMSPRVVGSETTDSVNEAEAETLIKESDEQPSSVETRSLEEPAHAEPTGQVTEEPDITRNVPETGDDSISTSPPEVTETPHTDTDLQREEEEVSSPVDVSRKSTFTSNTISEEHFTEPQESQTHPIPDHSAGKRSKEESNTGNVNTTQNSPALSLEDNSLKSTEVAKQDKAAELETPVATKRFGLFRRLRGDQSKKTKEKRAQKMQVPKILIQDFSDGTGKVVQDEGEEQLSSRERRRRRRERERQEKEEERSRKKKEKEMEKEKERERKKPQTRGKSFQIPKKTDSIDSAQLTQIRFFNSYAESYF